MERIAMSQEERDGLDWLKRARDGKLTQREAAEKMGVSERWVRKLLRRMKLEGDRVVVHGLRGRASNRKIAASTREQALEALRDPDWHDFGPTFAADELEKQHQIKVSEETLRPWMIEAGYGNPARARCKKCTAGDRDAVPSASWCSGTPATTIGWKVEARCVIWCA